MYITSNRSQTGHTAGGQQRAGGLFLILFSPTGSRELRGVVRSVQLRQLGHFMMGGAKVGGHDVTVSGAYGHDGLPLDPRDFPGIWDRLVPLPETLVDAFWSGGGHNSSGNEEGAMRRWANANLVELQKAARSARKPSTQKRHGPKPGYHTTKQRRLARKAASKGVVLTPAQIRKAALWGMGSKYPEGLDQRAKDLAQYRTGGMAEYDARNRGGEYYHGPNFDPRNKPQAWEHERFMKLPKPRIPNPARKKRATKARSRKAPARKTRSR